MVAAMIAEAGAALVVKELRGARVLLVEDCELVREVGRTLLEDAGVVVEEAEDGAMAVRMALDGHARYSLILMDVQMPVLDGLAATRAIRADLGERAPPIVALTAQAADHEKQICREAGMSGHLAKPIDPDQLVDVLNSCARRPLGPRMPDGTNSEAADGPPQQRVADVPAVPGFELAAGLRSANGRSDLLRSLLARFGHLHAGIVPALRERLSAGDYSEARRLAHTLKGTAATLGGTRIAQAAQALEHALQQFLPGAGRASTHTNESPVAQIAGNALDQLEVELQHALPALLDLRASQHVAAPPSAAGAQAELPQACVAAFAELRRLLAGNHYTARKAFSDLRAELAGYDAQWQAAAAAVEAMQFGQALAQLDARYPRREGVSV